MTFEEAKKILKKEGFELEKVGRPCSPTIVFTAYESPEICEAMQVVCSAGYSISMVSSRFDDRKARLSLELAENSAPMPGPGEEQSKEGNLKAATKMFGAQARKIMRLKAENAKLRETIDKMKEGNPALAESAAQFNDALLDEQGKKIKRLGKEIARLNKIIRKKNLKIEELRKESSRHLGEKMKMFGENFDLEQKLKDEVAVLGGVAEGLRLSKIREKNLTELCQKYIKANEELKEKLANNVVDKIDAQALKSAESALAWKEKVIAEKDMALAYNEKEIADLQEKLKSIYKNRHIERVYKKKLVEKDEVIDNLHKELKAQKGLVNHISKKYDGAKINLNLRMKECEKLKEALEEKTKKEINDIARGKENKKPRIPTPEEPKHDNSFEDFINKTIDNYNRRAANLGCVGSKDGNGIFDQMVGVDNAEEGADLSGVIVLGGKDLIDAIKKMK